VLKSQRERPPEHWDELLGVRPPKGGESVEEMIKLVEALTAFLRVLADLLRIIFKRH
jgi:hypothetical protein